MTLKVIGAGYGRTGTLSTYTALNELGFPCYHMFEVIENKANKSHLDFWRGVANTPAGTRHDWNSVLSDYTAAVDNPACCVWRELKDAYPEAKVLLTLHPRGPDAWYESTIDTIYFTENRWQFKLLKLVAPFARKMGDMSRKLIWQRNHKGTMNDRAQAIAQYNQHIEDVKAAVPPDQLLDLHRRSGLGAALQVSRRAGPCRTVPQRQRPRADQEGDRRDDGRRLRGAGPGRRRPRRVDLRGHAPPRVRPATFAISSR